MQNFNLEYQFQQYLKRVGLEEFMTGFAFRWQEYSGHKIKFKTIEEFLYQLIQTGYMKEF